MTMPLNSPSFCLRARPNPPWRCLLCPPASSASRWSNLPGVWSADTGSAQPDVYQRGVPCKLGLAQWSERDGLVYIPRSYHPHEPCPLVVTLHSGHAGAKEALAALLPFAEEHRLILAAPESRGGTWSAGSGLLNEDVGFIDRALDTLFQKYSVQEDKVGLAGFSTGASFALDLGVRNGPLISHVMAFSPTDPNPPCYEDGPEIFISYAKNGHGGVQCQTCHPLESSSCVHGSHSSVVCRNVIPRLRSWGYSCQVHEFPRDPIDVDTAHGADGGSFAATAEAEGIHHKARHSMPRVSSYVDIPNEVVASAVDWFSRGTGSGSRLPAPDYEFVGFRSKAVDAAWDVADFKFPMSMSCPM